MTSNALYHVVSDAHKAVLHPGDPGDPVVLIDELLVRLTAAKAAVAAGEFVAASAIFDPHYEAKRCELYFAVSGSYTIGRACESYQEACSIAKGRIREVAGCPGVFTREFVDFRVKDEGGDRPLYRVEVFADGSTAGRTDDRPVAA